MGENEKTQRIWLVTGKEEEWDGVEQWKFTGRWDYKVLRELNKNRKEEKEKRGKKEKERAATDDDNDDDLVFKDGMDMWEKGGSGRVELL